MKANDDLHRLVHSLSPSEKRYFRLSVLHAREEKHNYIRLFDALLSQKAYDQEALLAQFKDKRMGSRISAEKKHLFQLILRAMRNYDATRNARIKIRGLITDGSFLYGKALYEPCAKIFKRAHKLAEEHEDFPALVEIMIWERKLIKRKKGKRMSGLLEQQIAEKDHTLALLENQFAYFDLYDRLFLLTQQENQLRAPAQLAQIQTLISHPLMAEIQNAHSFQARHFFLQIKAYYHQLKGESVVAYHWYGKLVDLWKASPLKVREESEKYKVVLSNYLALCAITDAFDEFPALIKELRSMPSGNPHESVRAKQNLILYELQYYMNLGEFEKGIGFIQENYRWVEKHADLLSRARIMGIYSNCATLYFFNSNFREALRWVNRLLAHPASENRLDIQHQCRLLQLMIHLELGNDDLLENLIRATQRFFHGRNRLFPYEKTFLKRLRKLISLPAGERPAQFADLAQQLQAISREVGAGHHAGTIEISIWLQSKVANISLPTFAKQFLLSRVAQGGIRRQEVPGNRS